MKSYTLAQLKAAETYAADPALATLARRVAEEQTHLNMPTGERKRLALAGGMAQAVYEAVMVAAAASAKAHAADADNQAAFQELALRPGWTVDIGASEAVFRGPKSDPLTDSLVRHGKWDSMRQAWRVPRSKGRTLARSLKRAEGPGATSGRMAEETAHRRAEVERWLGYVEEKAPSGYLYKRGVDECHAHGIANFPELSKRLVAAVDLARARAGQAKRPAPVSAFQPAPAPGRAEKQPQSRMLHLLASAPPLNTPLQLHDAVVVYTGAGKAFHVDKNHPSVWGHHLLGHEGEPCAYFYYRPATPEEAGSRLPGIGPNRV